MTTTESTLIKLTGNNGKSTLSLVLNFVAETSLTLAGFSALKGKGILLASAVNWQTTSLSVGFKTDIGVEPANPRSLAGGTPRWVARSGDELSVYWTVQGSYQRACLPANIKGKTGPELETAVRALLVSARIDPDYSG